MKKYLILAPALLTLSSLAIADDSQLPSALDYNSVVFEVMTPNIEGTAQAGDTLTFQYDECQFSTGSNGGPICTLVNTPNEAPVVLFQQYSGKNTYKTTYTSDTALYQTITQKTPFTASTYGEIKLVDTSYPTSPLAGSNQIHLFVYCDTELQRCYRLDNPPQIGIAQIPLYDQAPFIALGVTGS